MSDKLRIQSRKKNDQYIAARDRYTKLVAFQEKENKKLSGEYKKFTRYFIILQKKFESFERADKERYNEIMRMNQHEVRLMC